jgi:hypothetical protein
MACIDWLLLVLVYDDLSKGRLSLHSKPEHESQVTAE